MKLDNHLELSYSNSFRQLTPEERSKLHFMAEGEGVCIRDDEHHILISVGWHEINAFLGFLFNDKDLAENMKKNIRKMSSPYHFRDEEDIKTDLGGKTAEGIRYRYDAENIEMISESYVLKMNKTIYYFHFYTRAALFMNNKEIWDDILKTVRWT